MCADGLDAQLHLDDVPHILGVELHFSKLLELIEVLVPFFGSNRELLRLEFALLFVGKALLVSAMQVEEIGELLSEEQPPNLLDLRDREFLRIVPQLAHEFLKVSDILLRLQQLLVEGLTFPIEVGGGNSLGLEGNR